MKNDAETDASQVWNGRTLELDIDVKSETPHFRSRDSCNGCEFII